MKIPALPFTVTDWSKIEPTIYKGEQGEARWRTLDIGAPPTPLLTTIFRK